MVPIPNAEKIQSLVSIIASFVSRGHSINFNYEKEGLNEKDG
jgi:hypothetical protein